MMMMTMMMMIIIIINKIRDPENVADSFNNLFLKITENFSLHQAGGNKKEATLFLKETFPGNFPGTEKIYEKLTWRKNMINALKSKILGYDEITHKILQTLSPHISHLLSYNYTHTHTHTQCTVHYTSSLHIKNLSRE